MHFLDGLHPALHVLDIFLQLRPCLPVAGKAASALIHDAAQQLRRGRLHVAHQLLRRVRVVAAKPGGVDVDIGAGHLAVLVRHLQLDEDALAVPASAAHRPVAAQFVQRPAEVLRLGIRRRAFHGALLVRPLLQGIALQLPQPVLDVLQAQSLAQLRVVVGRVYARAALRPDEAVAQPRCHHRALAELRAHLHIRAVQQQVGLRLCYLIPPCQNGSSPSSSATSSYGLPPCE